MNATLITHEQQQAECIACTYSVADAAKKLGVSESTIRLEAKRLGVKKIAGSVVAGFIRWERHPVPVCLPYAD